MVDFINALHNGDFLAYLCFVCFLTGLFGLTALTLRGVERHTRISRRGALRFWRIGRLQISWCIVRRRVAQ